MAETQNRSAAELKAELSAAIAQSRALLGEASDAPAAALKSAGSAGDAMPDRLTGMELSFDDDALASIDDFDYTSLSDEELEILLKETDPGADSAQNPKERLIEQIAKNPLPWALGALVIGGVVGVQGLRTGDSQSKNPRQNASQTRDSAITHGSLMGQLMKTALETAKPALLEAVQGWLTRFVEKKP